MILEYKQVNCSLKAQAEQKRNGVKVGIISGLLNTFDEDRGMDQFVRGGAKKSIERHKKENRPIRFRSEHGVIIGGFFEFEETESGVEVVGEISLETETGPGVYSLAKMGVLTDLSVGYEVLDHETKDGVRFIKEYEIWEGSIVAEPMNPNAKITSVKSLEQKYSVEALEKMTPRELESVFKNVMTKSAAVKYANKLIIKNDDLENILLDLKSMKE